MLASRDARSGLAVAALAALLALPIAGCGDKSDKLRVTGLDTRTGDAAGGTRLAVKGSNFQKVTRTAKIYFGEEQGSVLRFVDDSTLLVEAPGGKPGEAVDVLVVFEPGGEITIPHAFTYVDRTPMSARDLSTPP
ncbi:MAG TPA: IPT/TIG domain-containing protein [Kofleriaceae bacterium]|nr:IPT/TIG domain-containing protein [Kofleriaceae bacterium]